MAWKSFLLVWSMDCSSVVISFCCCSSFWSECLVVMVIDSRASNNACKDIICLDQESFASVSEG
jgi:hypothetical protein